MSWLWGDSTSSDQQSSEQSTRTFDLTSTTTDTPDSTSYDFTRPSASSFNYDEEDDDSDLDEYKSTFSDPTADDSNYLALTSPTSSSSLGPRVDFTGLDSISPNTIGLPGYDPTSIYGNPLGGSGSDFQTVRRKGLGEQLTYLGGLSYLFGAATGGTLGLLQALNASRGKTLKLRINAVLNGMGKRGALLANSMGILGLLFGASEHFLFNSTREEDPVHYAVAGGIAGGLYKSTRGLKVAGMWGLAGAAVGLGAVYASRQGVYGREVQGLL